MLCFPPLWVICLYVRSFVVIGKAEGIGKEWRGHISAVTVAPEFRRLGLAGTLMKELERVSDKMYGSLLPSCLTSASLTLPSCL